MPPVRWKPLIIAMVAVWAHAVVDCDSSKLDSLSMTEDGWRPIVGSRREPTYEDEITHYRNPANKKSEAIKAEKPERKIATQPATTVKSTSIPYQGAPNLGSKIPPHSKPLILLPPHGAHGPQIPLGAMMHRPIKYGHIMKMNPYKRHKPIRMQMPAYSTRDEIFVPAPSSNLGPYAFYTPNPLKSRPPPHSHIDYTNHFGLPQDDLYQVVRAPVQQYALPPKHQHQNDIQQYTLKHPIQNDVHYFQGNDEFTRNLVPPPFKFEKEKTAVKEEVAKPSNILQQPANPFQPPVEVEVTKEKFKVFRNTVPPQIFNLQDEIEYHTLKTPKPNYEVTEGKQWQDPYHYYSTLRTPVKSRRPQPIVFTEEAKPFLPTPLKPDVAPPTLPTESEVSTIYNQISQLNKLKEAKPTSFDIKEVSTHFPIFGIPDQQYPTKISLTDTFEINEITTRTPTTTYFAYTSSTRPPPPTTTTTTQAPTTTFTTRKRQNQRRRRPTTPKVTTTEEAEELSTELYDSQKTESEEVTEKPKQQQQRRPNRFRTTTPQYEEEFTTRTRHRRPRPTTEADVPSNHKATYSEQPEIYDESKLQPEIRVVTEKEFPASFESHFHKNEDYEQAQRVIENFEASVPNRFYNNPPQRDEKPQKLNLQQESSTESVTLYTPENEIDYTTRPYYHYTTELTTEAATTPTTTTSTTTTTTTTTEAPATTTTKMHRRRPIKYDNSNRPRFSVKEYRQRLSTSTTTTPEPSKAPTYPENMRNRFPHRSRRPITTIGHAAEEEESTEPIIRSKFMPKDRYNQETTISDNQKQFKPVNTRLRPFGRYKTTTEPSSTTQKISIKPNIFSNLRRPTPISLKTRILNKQRSTTEKPVETTQNEEETNETDMSEIIESTLPYNVETTTEFGTRFTIDVETTTSKKDETDILKNEDFMQSQIVSELTSSAKNEYNKPGLFKNVSPTSRKVPSYFTLATDDPILPIEAFFPNLKQ